MFSRASEAYDGVESVDEVVQCAEFQEPRSVEKGPREQLHAVSEHKISEPWLMARPSVGFSTLGHAKAMLPSVVVPSSSQRVGMVG